MSHSPTYTPERSSQTDRQFVEPVASLRRLVEVDGRASPGTTTDARMVLHEAVSAAAEAASRALFLAQVLDEALALLQYEDAAPLTLAPARVSSYEAGELSPREREVLALVAAGQ